MSAPGIPFPSLATVALPEVPAAGSGAEAFTLELALWSADAVTGRPLTQLGVAAYLWSIGEGFYATLLFGLVLPQIFSQYSFLQDPVANDVKYQAAAQPFLVFGIRIFFVARTEKIVAFHV
jgi:hypothetical protein